MYHPTSSSISINSNSNDSNKRNTQRIKQIHQQITLTQVQIQQLFSHKQNKHLNSIALEKMEIELFDEGLVYLLQAERMLQRAGQKQRQVERKVIICTLHNIACCYQKNWELDKCSNYLQALIFNLNSVLNHNHSISEGNNGINNNWSNINNGSSLIINELNSVVIKGNNNSGLNNAANNCPKALNPKIANLMINIQARYMLGRYYLQFCAVNSQINNHSGALIAARKSIQTMKKMFQQLLYFIKNFNSRSTNNLNQQQQKQQREQFEQKTRLIYQVSRLADNINISQYEMILQTTRHYLHRWQSLEYEKQSMFSRLNQQLQQKFRNFSIGSIAQIDSVEYDTIFVITQVQKIKLLSIQSVMQKVLVMIIGYFTISTQLRLLVGSQNPISQLSQRNSSTIQNHLCSQQQTREAEIYHLFSIILTAVFIPFDILYMKHILLSYRNHFKNDLFLIENDKNSNDQKLYEQFLFTISEIKKGSLLGLQCEDSLARDSRKTNDLFGNGFQGKKYSFINRGSMIDNNQNNEDDVGFNKLKVKNKDNRTKTKSKNKSKKQTLKTISALSAQSKNKSKIRPLNSKSPQIHTQPSLSKEKNKKSSLKSNTKITSLQYLIDDIKKKQKSKQAIKKHEYAGIKPNDLKKKKTTTNTIQQTNAYFLKKTPSSSKVKPQGSKSKSKESKIKSIFTKGLTPNNPTELYYHKQKQNQKKSKSKSKQKSLNKKVSHQLAPKITISGAVNPSLHLINNLPMGLNSKKSLYVHYS